MTGPDPQQPAGEAEVELANGERVTGTIPYDARTSLSGWFRSPGGALMHADGPGQTAALVGRGYTEVPEEEAVAEIGGGVTLTVDPADAADGTFDAAAVNTAVRDEGSQAAKRSAAAKKAAATRARKKAEAEAAAADSPPEG